MGSMTLARRPTLSRRVQSFGANLFGDTASDFAYLEKFINDREHGPIHVYSWLPLYQNNAFMAKRYYNILRERQNLMDPEITFEDQLKREGFVVPNVSVVFRPDLAPQEVFVPSVNTATPLPSDTVNVQVNPNIQSDPGTLNVGVPNPPPKTDAEYLAMVEKNNADIDTINRANAGRDAKLPDVTPPEPVTVLPPDTVSVNTPDPVVTKPKSMVIPAIAAIAAYLLIKG